MSQSRKSSEDSSRDIFGGTDGNSSDVSSLPTLDSVPASWFQSLSQAGDTNLPQLELFNVSADADKDSPVVCRQVGREPWGTEDSRRFINMNMIKRGVAGDSNARAEVRNAVSAFAHTVSRNAHEDISWNLMLPNDLTDEDIRVVRTIFYDEVIAGRDNGRDSTSSSGVERSFARRADGPPPLPTREQVIDQSVKHGVYGYVPKGVRLDESAEGTKAIFGNGGLTVNINGTDVVIKSIFIPSPSRGKPVDLSAIKYELQPNGKPESENRQLLNQHLDALFKALRAKGSSLTDAAASIAVADFIPADAENARKRQASAAGEAPRLKAGSSTGVEIFDRLERPVAQSLRRLCAQGGITEQNIDLLQRAYELRMLKPGQGFSLTGLIKERILDPTPEERTEFLHDLSLSVESAERTQAAAGTESPSTSEASPPREYVGIPGEGTAERLRGGLRPSAEQLSRPNSVTASMHWPERGDPVTGFVVTDGSGRSQFIADRPNAPRIPGQTAVWDSLPSGFYTLRDGGQNSLVFDPATRTVWNVARDGGKLSAVALQSDVIPLSANQLRSPITQPLVRERNALELGQGEARVSSAPNSGCIRIGNGEDCEVAVGQRVPANKGGHESALVCGGAGGFYVLRAGGDAVNIKHANGKVTTLATGECCALCEGDALVVSGREIPVSRTTEYAFLKRPLNQTSPASSPTVNFDFSRDVAVTPSIGDGCVYRDTFGNVPPRVIDPSHPVLAALVEDAKKRIERLGPDATPDRKALELARIVNRYSAPVADNQGDTTVLDMRAHGLDNEIGAKGIQMGDLVAFRRMVCLDQAMLLKFVMEKSGFENVRVVSGAFRGGGHAWCEVQIGGKSQIFDPRNISSQTAGIPAESASEYHPFNSPADRIFSGLESAGGGYHRVDPVARLVEPLRNLETAIRQGTGMPERDLNKFFDCLKDQLQRMHVADPNELSRFAKVMEDLAKASHAHDFAKRITEIKGILSSNFAKSNQLPLDRLLSPETPVARLAGARSVLVVPRDADVTRIMFQQALVPLDTPFSRATRLAELERAALGKRTLPPNERAELDRLRQELHPTVQQQIDRLRAVESIRNKDGSVTVPGVGAQGGEITQARVFNEMARLMNIRMAELGNRTPAELGFELVPIKAGSTPDAIGWDVLLINRQTGEFQPIDIKGRAPKAGTPDLYRSNMIQVGGPRDPQLADRTGERFRQIVGSLHSKGSSLNLLTMKLPIDPANASSHQVFCARLQDGQNNKPVLDEWKRFNVERLKLIDRTKAELLQLARDLRAAGKHPEARDITQIYDHLDGKVSNFLRGMNELLTDRNPDLARIRQRVDDEVRNSGGTQRVGQPDARLRSGSAPDGVMGRFSELLSRAKATADRQSRVTDGTRMPPRFEDRPAAELPGEAIQLEAQYRANAAVERRGLLADDAIARRFQAMVRRYHDTGVTVDTALLERTIRSIQSFSPELRNDPVLSGMKVVADSSLESGGRLVYRHSGVEIKPIGRDAQHMYVLDESGTVKKLSLNEVSAELHVSAKLLQSSSNIDAAGKWASSELFSTLYHAMHQVDQLTGRKERAESSAKLRIAEGAHVDPDRLNRFLEAERAVVDCCADFLQYELNGCRLRADQPPMKQSAVQISLESGDARADGAERVVTSVDKDGRIRMFVIDDKRVARELSSDKVAKTVHDAYDRLLAKLDEKIERAAGEEKAKLEAERARLFAERDRYKSDLAFRAQKNIDIGRVARGLRAGSGLTASTLMVVSFALETLRREDAPAVENLDITIR